MTKQVKTNPADTMRMNIELADNGIILRNPDIEDDVQLAMTQNCYTSSPDHTQEHRAIGERIYDWLIDSLLQDHEGEIITTGFELKIEARLTGRPMD